MRTTNALAASMRRLLANFHPPSPPTARESQQLLSVLQKSFKSRLDERHPAPSQYEFWPKNHEQNDIPVTTQSTSSYATSTHLSSILTNPILGPSDGLRMRKDAISRFDKLVSEPEVDFPHLTALMRVYSRGLRAGEQQRQHGERLSDRLNSWLHVTDRSSREAFLLNRETRLATLDLFNSERNEAVIWTWLRLVYERRLVQADVTSMEWLQVEDDLVSGLMRLSIQRQDNADAAQQFLEACRYRLDSGRWALLKYVDQADSRSPYPAMLSSGTRLASAIMFHRHQHGIDSTLFKNVLQYLPMHLANAKQNYEFCVIYNPDNPSAKEIWKILKDYNFAHKLTQSIATDKPRSRKIIMTSLLDASKVALDAGRRSEASFILDFAIDNFPEYLPARVEEQIEPEIERYLDLIPG
jgi:hypothetical protein